MKILCNKPDLNQSCKIKPSYLLVKIDGIDQQVMLKTKNLKPDKDGPLDSVWYIQSQSSGTKYHVFKQLDQSQEMLFINIVGPKQPVYQAYEEVLRLMNE